MDTANGGLAIPIIWGTDAVHGHNNVIGATLFPHNIGLGAAHDPDLMERIGAATAREVAATGLDWTFAPLVAVVRDDRWGRTYESYSEDPEIVRAYAERMVRGLQGTPGSTTFLDSSHVLATAKHFIGDGGTADGVDRGDNLSSEADLQKIHAPGYIAAMNAGVQTIMASYNSWQGVEGARLAVPAHRRAQAAHGVRRHRRQRLGRRRRSAGLLQGQVRAGHQCGHRHGHGADGLEELHRQYARPGAGGEDSAVAHRRCGDADPAREIPRGTVREGQALVAAARDQARAARRSGASRAGAPGRARIAGAAEERAWPAAAAPQLARGGARRRRRQHSASRPAAGL